jgi:hypothetical protein
MALIIAIGSFYVGRDWWIQSSRASHIVLASIAGFLVLTCYFISVVIRSRKPMLAIGKLRPVEDAERQNCFFQMRVENLGPGRVRPVVRISYLRDGTGKFLPIASAFLGQEVHWRYFNSAEEHKYLGEGEEAYAGVFWVREPDSEAPQVWLYPITLRPETLWTDIPLSEQTGLRLKIAVQCRVENTPESEMRVTKRSYVLKPDKSQSLKYKVMRVRVRSLFWPD